MKDEPNAFAAWKLGGYLFLVSHILDALARDKNNNKIKKDIDNLSYEIEQLGKELGINTRLNSLLKEKNEEKRYTKLGDFTQKVGEDISNSFSNRYANLFYLATLSHAYMTLFQSSDESELSSIKDALKEFGFRLGIPTEIVDRFLRDPQKDYAMLVSVACSLTNKEI